MIPAAICIAAEPAEAMPRLPVYHVDAFAARLFTGNPAAVVPLQSWLPDALLQAIAAENQLAETAFFAPPSGAPGAALSGGGADYLLRWFSPSCEVALCGHATLASAFVLWQCLDHAGARIEFDTVSSGRLGVTREDDDSMWLDFPAQDALPAEAPALLIDAMGHAPLDVRAGPNWLLRYADEAAVRALAPDLRALAALPARGVIATAPAAESPVDFVSRFFAPNFGIDEDAVTGSAHCMLAPYWGQALNKTVLAARQISARGGALRCELAGERVRIGGQAVLYSRGEIHLPDEEQTP